MALIAAYKYSCCVRKKWTISSVWSTFSGRRGCCTKRICPLCAFFSCVAFDWTPPEYCYCFAFICFSANATISCSTTIQSRFANLNDLHGDVRVEKNGSPYFSQWNAVRIAYQRLTQRSNSVAILIKNRCFSRKLVCKIDERAYG